VSLPRRISGKVILVISGRSRMMYQSLEPEPEGAILSKRSVPQGSYSTPHDAGASMANWLKTNIQGFVAETLRDNVVNYVCRDRADLLWQYADCARLVDESGKKGWPKLDGPQRGQVHPGLIWPDAVGARPSSRARTRPLLSLDTE